MIDIVHSELWVCMCHSDVIINNSHATLTPTACATYVRVEKKPWSFLNFYWTENDH